MGIVSEPTVTAKDRSSVFQASLAKPTSSSSETQATTIDELTAVRTTTIFTSCTSREYVKYCMQSNVNLKLEIFRTYTLLLFKLCFYQELENCKSRLAMITEIGTNDLNSLQSKLDRAKVFMLFIFCICFLYSLYVCRHSHSTYLYIHTFIKEILNKHTYA